MIPGLIKMLHTSLQQLLRAGPKVDRCALMWCVSFALCKEHLLKMTELAAEQVEVVLDLVIYASLQLVSFV